VLSLPRLRNDRTFAQLDLEIELIMNRQFHRSRPRPPALHRQRGTMLIISLIVLVAMTLAGIATMRSVDTASLVAGNVGFRQATVNSADQGLQAAYAWLLANQNDPSLMNGNTVAHSPTNSQGYWPSVGTTDQPWTDPATWLEAALVPGAQPDPGNNYVSYRIERMCPTAGNPSGCASTPSNSAAGGGGDGSDKGNLDQYKGLPFIHFRVTVRALGPRGSLAFVQAMFRGM
jgi:Tfp pilus assembly protein PilX